MEIGVDIDIFQDTREGKLSMKNNKILSEADYIAKEHYKMYKAGKKWMVAGITAVSILGAVAMAEGTASADQVANVASGTDPAVVKVDEAAATSQSATTVTLSASASVSSVASEVPAVTEVSASSEVVSSVVASEAVSSSSDVESSVAPASVSASVEASSSVSASVTPVASVSASVESATVAESVASSVAPVVNGHDSVAMSSMMSSAESAKAAGSVVAMKAVLANSAVSASTAGTVAQISDLDNSASSYASYSGSAISGPHHLEATTSSMINSHFTSNGTAKTSGSGIALVSSADQAGAFVFDNKVDMTKDWNLSFTVAMSNVANQKNEYGDFLGLVIMDVAPGSVAGAQDTKYGGGGLGIAGVKNATVWGIDNHVNSDYGDKNFGGWVKNGNTATAIGFRTTDANGSLTSAAVGSTGVQGVGVTYSYGGILGLGAYTDDPAKNSLTNATSAFTGSMAGYSYAGDVTAKYVANGDGTGVLTITIGSMTWSRTIGVAGVNTMAVGILGKNGQSVNSMAARVNSFSTYLGTTKNTVQYVDKAGNSIDGVTSTSFIANAGDTLTVDAKATNATTSGTNVTAGVPAIPGYKFTGLVVTDAQGNKTSYSATDVANIVMTSDSTITFNYAKMSSDTFTITDQDGNAVTVPGAQTTYTVGGDDTSVDGTAYTSSVSGYTR